LYETCPIHGRTTWSRQFDRLYSISWRSDIDSRHIDESATERAMIGFRGTIWPKTKLARLDSAPPSLLLSLVDFTSLILFLLLFYWLLPHLLPTFVILVLSVSATRWEKRWFHSSGMVTRQRTHRIYTRDFFVPVAIQLYNCGFNYKVLYDHRT